MGFVILFTYLLIFPSIWTVLLYRILVKLEEMKEAKQKEENKVQRVHTKVKTSNYSNSFGNRSSYDIYKNKSGLYEPQKPHQGIELKKKEE